MGYQLLFSCLLKVMLVSLQQVRKQWGIIIIVMVNKHEYVQIQINSVCVKKHEDGCTHKFENCLQYLREIVQNKLTFSYINYAPNVDQTHDLPNCFTNKVHNIRTSYI